ncbi:MAG: hypothetical protein JF599_01845 [Verrucomicrobia bacterium]|nr:hypothetical protein [Verrucomicrobiota bacterium]
MENLLGMHEMSAGIFKRRVAGSFGRSRLDRRGFALLVTITLLSFLVLLLVSLAALTRVETQVASNSQQLAQARQNALMALNIALGQLQKTAGPDQRVTGNADLAAAKVFTRGSTTSTRLNAATAPTAADTKSLAGTSNGLVGSQAGTRYWTGVWGNNTLPTAIYTTPGPSPVLLNWLVSGNELATFTVPDPKNGQVTATTAPPYRPYVASLVINPALSPSTQATDALKLGSQDAVLLVGKNTAGSAAVTLADGATEQPADRYVVAPLVPINAPANTVPGLASSAPIGRYAYWIGDEGVKAQYNLVDDYASSTLPVTQAEARYRLMSAQRTGIEALTSLTAYPVNGPALKRVVETGQIRFADSTATTDAIAARFHSITTQSQGVLADSLSGGLRKDLTYAFEQGSLPAALKGVKIIPTSYSPSQGPQWDLLKSFYDTATSANSGTIDVRPATATQVGIAPIVSDIRLLFGLDPGGTDATQPVKALFSPVFVLSNPYTVALRAQAGLDVVFRMSSIGRTGATADKGQLYYGNIGTKYYLLRHNPDGTRTSLLDGVVFKIPGPITIPAGQAIICSLSGTQTDVTTVNMQTKGASGISYFGKTVAGSNSKSALYFIDEDNNSTEIDIDFYVGGANTADTSNSSQRVQHIERLNLDTTPANNAGTDFGANYPVSRTDGAFPIAVFLSNISYPGDPGPTTPATIGNVNRTLRVFADFNMRATHHRTTTGMRGPPPYFFRYIFRAGTSDSKTGGTLDTTSFTQSVSSGSTAHWARAHEAGSVTEGALFDLPRRSSTAEMPLFSLGQLQHADVTADDDAVSVGHQPGYAIGNSFYNPYVSWQKTVASREDLISQADTLQTTNKNYYDLSYLLNCSLWDQYFFSTIPQTSQAYEPLNKRLLFSDASLASATAATKATAVHDFDKAAGHLLINGAFNINSTSIDAWKAVLAGTRGLNMPGDTQTEAAFPRTVRQSGIAAKASGELKPTGDEDDTYKGFRRLSDDQLEKLATQIVKQVRLRGPFVSVAHFINRSLVAVDDTKSDLGLMGPLQAAIQVANDPAANDRIGLNAMSDVAATDDRLQVTSATDYQANFGGTRYFGTSFLYADSSGGNVPSASAAPEAVLYTGASRKKEQGFRTTAAPGWLTQADLLQVLGPVLSARSDTFLVRTYGDVKNPVTGNVTGRAWCEAVVQRMPEYTDASSAGNQAYDAMTALTTNNLKLGRRFKVVSFRWLGPNDI